MIESNHIIPWLRLLHKLFPPTGAILVGAGAGTSPWVRLLDELDVQETILVEASDVQFSRLKQNVSHRPDWILRKEVLALRCEAITFYEASNSAESGLLDPETLQDLWPNIKTRFKEPRKAIDLRNLTENSSCTYNWLIFDCLPAAISMIGDIDEQIKNFDVITIRILNNNEVVPAGIVNRVELDAKLSAFGYRCVANDLHRHPAIGHLLFVRDGAREIRNLADELEQHLKDHHAETCSLTGVISELSKVAEEQLSQLNRLTQEKSTADKLLEMKQVRFEEIFQKASAAEKLAAKYASEIKTINQQHGHAQKEKDNIIFDLTKQIAAFAEENRKLLSELSKQSAVSIQRAFLSDKDTSVRTLKSDLDGERQLYLQEGKKPNQKLESELSESQERQRIQKGELIVVAPQLFSSSTHWENRYKTGGTSGHGSYGILAEFKAKIINKFIAESGVRHLIEFGCGDGNQLSKISVNEYVGVDISSTIVQRCREKYVNDSKKIFFTNNEFYTSSLETELALSLDVIYHLVENEEFEKYMRMLFNSSKRYCIIYSCNEDVALGDPMHVRRRKFSDWIRENFPNWQLIGIRYNDFPYAKLKSSKNSSMSDFYFYKKCVAN